MQLARMSNEKQHQHERHEQCIKNVHTPFVLNEIAALSSCLHTVLDEAVHTSGQYYQRRRIQRPEMRSPGDGWVPTSICWLAVRTPMDEEANEHEHTEEQHLHNQSDDDNLAAPAKSIFRLLADYDSPDGLHRKRHHISTDEDLGQPAYSGGTMVFSLKQPYCTAQRHVYTCCEERWCHEDQCETDSEW
jgi:hypothetical protein